MAQVHSNNGCYGAIGEFNQTPPTPNDILREVELPKVSTDMALQDPKDVQDDPMRAATKTDPPLDNKGRNIFGDGLSLIDDDSLLDEYFPSLDLDSYTPVDIPNDFDWAGKL